MDTNPFTRSRNINQFKDRVLTKAKIKRRRKPVDAPKFTMALVRKLEKEAILRTENFPGYSMSVSTIDVQILCREIKSLRQIIENHNDCADGCQTIDPTDYA